MTFAGLRIGLIGPLPPPSGGMANQTRQLALLLRGEGAVVEVLQVNTPYRPAWVAGLRGLRALFRLVPYLLGLWRLGGRVDLFHVMANSGWSWHLYSAPAVWIARWCRVPVVVNYRGGGAERFLERAGAWIRPALRRVDALVLPSGFLQAVFARHGFSGRVVPNIIDLDRFRTPASPAAHRDRTQPHVILTRNLEPIYDVATALRAFRIVRQSIPGARLTVAGSGPELGRLRSLAAELGVVDAVEFSGRIDNERIAALYQSADLMLNSSLIDNMPISLLEALASGVPVVSTNVGGVPFVVENGRTAMLVPPQDPAAMAQAIIQVLSDAPLAARLAQAGLRHVQQFGWAEVRACWLEVYRELLLKSRIQGGRSCSSP